MDRVQRRKVARIPMNSVYNKKQHPRSFGEKITHPTDGGAWLLDGVREVRRNPISFHIPP